MARVPVSLQRRSVDTRVTHAMTEMKEPRTDRWPLASTLLLVVSVSGALWALIIQAALFLLG